MKAAKPRDWVHIPVNNIGDWPPGQLDQWLADELWECAYQDHDHEALMPAPEWFVKACRQVWVFRREHGL